MPAEVRKLDVSAADIEAMMADQAAMGWPTPTPRGAFHSLLNITGFHDISINAVNLAASDSAAWWHQKVAQTTRSVPYWWTVGPCACCGSTQMDNSVPCQGSDDCRGQICERCKWMHKCHACGVAACSEHLFADGCVRMCGICLEVLQAPTRMIGKSAEHEDARPLEGMWTPDERREWADLHGYTYRCRGCGQICDTPWCGCDAGAPDDEDMPEPEEDCDA